MASYFERISKCTTRREARFLLNDHPECDFVRNRMVYPHVKTPEVCLIFNELYQEKEQTILIMEGYAYFLKNAQLDFARVFTGFVEINDMFITLMELGEYRSFLYEIVKNGYMDVIHFLFEQGLDVNCSDTNNETILYHACSKKNVELIDLLINKGADINIKAKNSNETAIFPAVRTGEVQIVDRLILQGIDLNHKTHRLPLRPIDYAISHNHVKIVRRLVDMRVIIKEKHLLRAYSNLLREIRVTKLMGKDNTRIIEAKEIILIILGNGLPDVTNREILAHVRKNGCVYGLDEVNIILFNVFGEDRSEEYLM